MLFRMLLVALFLATSAAEVRATIVDTLGGFDAERMGWSGALESTLAASGGNTELFAVSSAARAQWQRGSQRVRALAGYTRQTSRGEEIAEDLLGHLRHNHRLRGPLHSLAFVQVQRNPFQRLRSRTLLGAGVRFDLPLKDAWSASVGLAHMAEWERTEDRSCTRRTQRLSSFLQGTVPISDTTTFELTAFAQPNWQDFADLRATGSAALKAAITERVDLLVAGSFSHDPRPPAGVEKADWGVRTGISLEI